VIAEAYFSPYSADVKEEVYLVTKSVTGILTDIAVTQGQLAGLTSLSWISSRSYKNLVGALGYWFGRTLKPLSAWHQW
jgi:hypothetical protein